LCSQMMNNGSAELIFLILSERTSITPRSFDV
jgi:hypothetical protein